MAEAKIRVTKDTFALMIEKRTLLENLCDIEKKEKAIENANRTENIQNSTVEFHNNLTVNEIRLREIKAEIRNVDIIQPEKQNQVVKIGNFIVLKYPDQTHTMKLDGASYQKNVISLMTPIGRELLGKKVGDSILVNGTTKVIIKEILLPKS